MFDSTEQPLSKKLLEPPQPCPNRDCTSSDGFHIWEKQFSGGRKVIDGYCFVCSTDSRDPYGDLTRSKTNEVKGNSLASATGSPARSQTPEYPGSSLSVEDGLAHPIRGITDRGISYATASYYGVRIGVSSTDGETPIYTLFPRHRDGDQIGWTTRTDDKRFYSTGGNDVDLFGAHLVKSTGKKLYITEGQYDALSLFQALKEGSSIAGYNPPVVSLPSGAAGACKSLSLSSELLEGYAEIVLVFDNDEAGKKARQEVCKAYAGKVSFCTVPYPHKDANDMLMAGKGSDLKWLALTGSKKYHPDGLIRVKDLREVIHDVSQEILYPYPDFMPYLNHMTYGARPGTIVTITSGSGCGKTQFMRELMYHFLVTTQEKIAGIFLEEDKIETAKGLMALHLNKRIHLPDIEVTEDELNTAFDALYDTDRVGLYDFFGGMDDSSLLSKLQYYAHTGHKFIFLDHLSIIVSEFATDGDERKRIDVLMTKLAKFVKSYGVTLFLVVHLRKNGTDSIPFELGSVPTLDDLRGSASLKQLSWDVFGLARNQQHTNDYCANTTESTVLKCRFTGRTGTADYLHFNETTGRMLGVEKPAGYRQGRGIRNDSI